MQVPGLYWLYCLAVFGLVVSPIVAEVCDVVPIEVWGGSPSALVEELPRPVELVVVAHTVTETCDTDEVCVAIANDIRNTQKEQGLNDIGLSFLIGGNGKIYEGAGWRVGSHTSGYNKKSISLFFIGDYRDVLPSEAALNAAQNFLRCFRNTQYLDRNYILVGQRQLVATISPGNTLQNLIRTWSHWSLIKQTRPH